MLLGNWKLSPSPRSELLGADGEAHLPLRHEPAFLALADDDVLALAARRQRDDHEAQVAVVAWREQLFDEARGADDDALAVGLAADEGRSLGGAGPAGPGNGVVIEELPEIDAERGAQALQRLDRGVRVAALDLADEAGRDARPLGELRDR